MTIPNVVKNFHNDVFSGWKPNFSYSEIEKDPLNSSFPFIELDFKWDVSEILNELESIENKDLWIPVQHAGRFLKKEWYHREDEYGWHEIRIMGPCPSPSKERLKDLIKPWEFIVRNNGLTNTQNFFKDKGLFFTRLVAVKLLPGGYGPPHIDNGIRVDGHLEKNLECFWIPINHCQDNCKTYPYGYVPHKVGSMFLFNNKEYWHSVMNRDSYPRYVLTGRIDSSRSKLDINFIKDSIKKQWYS
jgi:hypothetical protein